MGSTLKLGAVVLTALIVACDNSTGPKGSAVAGEYTATVLTTTTGGVTTNHLVNGATLDIHLWLSGTTTGEIFVPGGQEGGGDLIETMAGEWLLWNDTVTFSQQADTFMRDLHFRVSGKTLVADETFGSTRVQVTLQRP